MFSFKVGTVIQYFEKVGIAIVQLSNDLAVGERVKFQLGSKDLFEQEVKVIQVEHRKVDAAKAGSVIGLVTDDKVAPGTEIFKLQK